MRQKFSKLSAAILPIFIFLLIVFSSNVSQAQYLLNSDSAFKAGSPNSGRVWGYASPRGLFMRAGQDRQGLSSVFGRDRTIRPRNLPFLCRMTR